MSVLDFDIKYYGSAVMPDDDTGTDVGGAVDLVKRVVFDDILTTGTTRILSSSASDTTQTITVYGRTAGGALVNEAETLAGVAPQTTTTSFERILRVAKTAGGALVGDIMAQSTTFAANDTAQGGAAATASLGPYVQLAAGDSQAVDYYNGMVMFFDGGTGINQVREIIDFDDTNKRAYVNQDWDVVPDATTTYEIAPGANLEKGPNAVTDVRRLFYDVSAPASGADKVYYEKFFVGNTHATLDLTNAHFLEVTGGVATNVAYAIETTLNGTDSNGVSNNRQTLGDLSGYSWTTDQTALDFGNSKNFTSGAEQGIWVRLTLATSDVATNSVWNSKVTGQST